MLRDGFDVGEAGVVLVGGDGVAAVGSGSMGLLLLMNGMAWSGFGQIRLGRGHLDGKGCCLEEGLLGNRRVMETRENKKGQKEIHWALEG